MLLTKSATCRVRRGWCGVPTCLRAWSVPPSTPWAATLDSAVVRLFGPLQLKAALQKGVLAIPRSKSVPSHWHHNNTDPMVTSQERGLPSCPRRTLISADSIDCLSIASGRSPRKCMQQCHDENNGTTAEIASWYTECRSAVHITTDARLMMPNHHSAQSAAAHHVARFLF